MKILKIDCVEMSTINMMFILIFMLNVYIGAMQPGIDGSGNNGGNSTSVSH